MHEKKCTQVLNELLSRKAVVTMTQHHKSTVTLQEHASHSTSPIQVAKNKPWISLSGWPFQTLSTCCLFTAGSSQQTSVNTLLCILEQRRSFETIHSVYLSSWPIFPWLIFFIPSILLFFFWVSLHHFSIVFMILEGTAAIWQNIWFGLICQLGYL